MPSRKITLNPNEKSLYVTMGDTVYYIDNSTGEHIVSRWATGQDNGWVTHSLKWTQVILTPRKS